MLATWQWPDRMRWSAECSNCGSVQVRDMRCIGNWYEYICEEDDCGIRPFSPEDDDRLAHWFDED